MGLYYISREKINAKGDGSIFVSVGEVHKALLAKAVELQSKIQLRITEKITNEQGDLVDKTHRVATTVGRALIWEVVPDRMPFELVNCDMTKKNISRLVNYSYRHLGNKDTVVLADQIMYLGFRYATISGVSFGIEDMAIPSKKTDIINAAESEVSEIQTQYASGLVTDGERYNKVVDIWSHANDQVAKVMMDGFGRRVRRRCGRQDGQAKIIQLHFYDGGIRCAGFGGADSAVGGYAWLDGKARWFDHRNAHYR